jgi:hypothetical protein
MLYMYENDDFANEIFRTGQSQRLVGGSQKGWSKEFGYDPGGSFLLQYWTVVLQVDEKWIPDLMRERKLKKIASLLKVKLNNLFF